MNKCDTRCIYICTYMYITGNISYVIHMKEYLVSIMNNHKIEFKEG